VFKQADTKSMCAYFCYLFMMFYKFRQCKAVLSKFVYFLFLNLNISNNLVLNQPFKLKKSLEIETKKIQRRLLTIQDKTQKADLEQKLTLLNIGLKLNFLVGSSIRNHKFYCLNLKGLIPSKQIMI
jgi:hypothetical protein